MNRHILIYILSVVYPPTLLAQAPNVADEWLCKWCPFENHSGTGKGEMNNEITLSIGYLSDEVYRFSHYRGLGEKGRQLNGQIDSRFFDEEGHFFQLKAKDLGWDSRSLVSSAGKQGSYSLYLNYQELTSLSSNRAFTPYLGLNGNRLLLPVNWVAGPSTDALSQLAESLVEVDLEIKRKTLQVSATATPINSASAAPIGNATASPQNTSQLNNFSYKISYTRDSKNGKQPMGAAFGKNDAFAASASMLAAPIDTVTDQLEASVAYLGEGWQSQIGYYSSIFRNDFNALIWQNPFADNEKTRLGRLSPAPDNQFHQLWFSGNVQLPAKTSVAVYLARGRMSQDEDFLPYSINPTFSKETLPIEGLDAEVDTQSWKLSASSAPLKHFSLNIAYQYNDRGNRTHRYSFNTVVADTLLSPTPRANAPYSFNHQSAQADLSYRLSHGNKLTVGIKTDQRQRTFQEREDTTDDSLWARLRLNLHPLVSSTIKLNRSWRDGDRYQQNEIISPADNPLLRKFYLADRDKSALQLNLEWLATESVILAFYSDYVEEAFDNTEIGLKERSINSNTLDLTLIGGEHAQLYSYYTRESYQYRQSGSQTFPQPDWLSSGKDTVNTLGLGFSYGLVEDLLVLGIDYIYSKSEEDSDLNSDILDLSVLDLPLSFTRLENVTLYADYPLNEQLSLRLDLEYEQYQTLDFSLKNVKVDTLSKVILLGYDNEDYEVYRAAISAQLQF